MKQIISLRVGTCTDRAVKYLIANNTNFCNHKIKFVDSFQEGIEFFDNFGTNEDVILIPDVANEYGEIVMNKKYERDFDNIFWYQNPPLYLAKRKGTAKINTCSTLPILKNLLEDEFDFIYTKNTQEAAELCRDEKSDICITNQYGVEKNNLEIVQELKKINVMWVPFKKVF